MFVITGGGSGIGRALALALSQHGKNVLIIGRRLGCLQECAALSPLIHYLCADVSTSDGIAKVVAHLNAYPAIDGLVNNAGTLNPIGPLRDIKPDEWEQALATNLNAPLFLTQALFDKLAGGRVLNIGSGAAYFAIQGWSAYCVTKAALSMLTLCLQKELSTVFCASVRPGIVDTDMQMIARDCKALDDEQIGFYQRLKNQDALVEPDVVASFLLWLLCDVALETYVSKEWDVYDTSHHEHWLKQPNRIVHWESVL